MNFKEHSDLSGKHAFLSPSNYHWINYDPDKLEARFISAMAAKRGTDLHEFAHMAIRLGIKMPKSRKTLHMYVNDAITHQMTVEQPLYYSENCFGHADTLSFRNRFLRVHDLKTGVRATSEHQLEVYAALFCLEIKIELRIYQTDEIRVYEPEPEDIARIMNTIMDHDRLIEQLKEGSVW
jgi:hypothetical protein